MDRRDNPQSPDRARISGRETAEVLAAVLKDQEQKAESRGKAPGPKGKNEASPAKWMMLAIVTGLFGYVWLGSPSWLETETPELSPELGEAGLRVEIFQQALLVEEFLDTQGRLPDDLAEAGDPYAEVEYQKIDARNYRLSYAGKIGAVEYVSTESLDKFLASSLTVIEGGNRGDS